MQTFEEIARDVRNATNLREAAEILELEFGASVDNRWTCGRRLDKLPEDMLLKRLRGRYIDIALVETTSTRFCALASRLSHESWHLASDETDKALLERLIRSGDEHAKGVRGKLYGIFLEAPRFVWAELDTYVVGRTPLGSTSTMHKEAKGLSGDELENFKSRIPEGTLQLRAFYASWHCLRRMLNQRRKHRLPSWAEVCEFIEEITVL